MTFRLGAKKISPQFFFVFGGFFGAKKSKPLEDSGTVYTHENVYIYKQEVELRGILCSGGSFSV